MNRTIRIAAAVLAVTVSAAPAVYAAPAIHAPALAMFGSSSAKNIKFSLRNDTSVPISVRCGDHIVQLDPGKPVKMSAPEGTRIVAASATPTHEAGSLVEQVTDAISGATVTIR